MLNRSLACAFGIAVALGASRPGTAARASDEHLREVLDHMQRAGDALHTLVMQFEQINTDYILGDKEHSSGELYLEVPGKIRWEYEKPVKKVLLVRGQKIQLYTPVTNQVHEFDSKEARGIGADLLVGFGRSNAEIGRRYDVELEGEDAGTVRLRLTPKPGSAASLFTSIELTIDKTRWIPVRSVFYEPNHDTTTLVFQDVRLNTELPPKIFELQLPSDVEHIR